MKALGKTLVFLILSQALWGQISFSGPDLSEDSRLLFKANFPGLISQEELFFSRIDDRYIRKLTVFPERMELLDGGNTLQIRNSSGASRIPLRGGLPQEGFSSAAVRGRVEEIAVSPNGRWILSIVPETYAYGTLILSEVSTGIVIPIASRVERPEKTFPASWSQDSRFFIYSRLGKLYYATTNFSVPLVDENFRLIGDGAINSISWGQGGDFFYLKGSTIYRVRGNELFTRSLYADILDIGGIAGSIPFEFDPHFDTFWMAPDANSLLLSKGGRNIFYYPLNLNDYNEASSGLPYLVLPGSCSGVQVFWPAAGGITLIASVQTATARVMAWRLDIVDSNRAFVSLAPPSSTHASLSPDGRLILFWGERGIFIYDYANWRLLTTISSSPSYSCLWNGNDEIIAGGDWRIERIRLAPGGGRVLSRDLICLSSAASYGFEDASRSVNGTARILAQNSGIWYVTDGIRPWAEIVNPPLRAASQVSSRYRVYLETQSSGPYENLPMIRNVALTGTFSLIAPPLTSAILSQSASNTRELGLCFDLYDDAEGLPEVLAALNRFGIKATFFLGGEFIRRYPSAARDIAEAGHEAASMFFSPIDLSDSRYQFDSGFIASGLARNEDEYFNATGRELALLWHAPWYVTSGEANIAAARAGYITVNRNIDPYDWVSREDEIKYNIPQYSAADMIDLLMARVISQTWPDAIIPIRLGLLSGGRSDYLFRHINVLLDALAEEGYTVVPVSKILNQYK
ncbi:MAG: polysaccharide deacetylase family protein [Treponema sp.]|jgi:peptidoglycan/xylan/chitin deacetylase (PgdA/CDA1 family)|nr:polysaccharide deacetylase family protein [Treponema sp.]